MFSNLYLMCLLCSTPCYMEDDTEVTLERNAQTDRPQRGTQKADMI